MSDLVVALVEDEAALEAFRRLLALYQERLPVDLRVPNLEDELRTLTQRYAAPGSALFLASGAGTPIGCVVASRLDAARIEIKRLSVEPSSRRSGAGRALTEAVIAFARSRAATHVVLDTHAGRLPGAYELYRKLGFVECEPYGVADYPNATFMELTL